VRGERGVKVRRTKIRTENSLRHRHNLWLKNSGCGCAAPIDLRFQFRDLA
jgi:hypothetical protein